MRKTLKEIAAFLEGEVVGDGSTVITGVAGIKEAVEGDITFLANPKYSSLIDSTRASAIITSRDVGKVAKPTIRTENPSLAFAKIISLAAPNEAKHPKGVHPTALIGKNVSLGEGVAIGPYAVIEDDVAIK